MLTTKLKRCEKFWINETLTILYKLFVLNNLKIINYLQLNVFNINNILKFFVKIA